MNAPFDTYYCENRVYSIPSIEEAIDRWHFLQLYTEVDVFDAMVVVTMMKSGRFVDEDEPMRDPFGGHIVPLCAFLNLYADIVNRGGVVAEEITDDDDSMSDPEIWGDIDDVDLINLVVETDASDMDIGHYVYALLNEGSVLPLREDRDDFRSLLEAAPVAEGWGGQDEEEMEEE